MKALLIIDNIPESMFAENISIRYELISYPHGQMKELGISGKQRLIPMPEMKPIYYEEHVNEFTNVCNAIKRLNERIDKILEGDEK